MNQKNTEIFKTIKFYNLLNINHDILHKTWLNFSTYVIYGNKSQNSVKSKLFLLNDSCNLVTYKIKLDTQTI